MIVTEEEAKTKRCHESFAAAQAIAPYGESQAIASPIAMGMSGGFALGGSMAQHTAPMMCIGTACMAWRWHDDQEYERGQDLQEGSNPADPGWEKDGKPYREVTTAGLVFWQRWRRPLPGRRGYCGKAGRGMV